MVMDGVLLSWAHLSRKSCMVIILLLERLTHFPRVHFTWRYFFYFGRLR
jgi:hypothetical protein